MNTHLETIDEATLDHVNGGIDWGVAHTVLTQGMGCAGGGALVGSMTSGPVGAMIGAPTAGLACAATSYLALRQQQAQQAQQAQQQAKPAAPK